MMSVSSDRAILVSGCLLGLRCRYDGASKHNPKVADHLQQRGLIAIPVCPEQLAGMSTPRPATRFIKGDGDAVLDQSGQVCNAQQDNMNEVFVRGARETLKVAQLNKCSQALLKERSPSCGVHQVYLEDEIVSGIGVTAALLKRHGLTLLSEEDI